MLLGNAGGGGKEYGEGEVRHAEGDEEVVPGEQEQEAQKESDRKALEEHDVEEAKAQEKVPVEEKTEAEPQHEDHQKAQHEDQKEQVQTNNDGEESMEADGEGAKGTDSEDPDAQAHEHDVREGAQEFAKKRHHALANNGPNEGEPVNKAKKTPAQSDGAETAAGLAQPLRCDAETLRDQGAEVNDGDETTPGGVRAAKRHRVLSQHPDVQKA